MRYFLASVLMFLAAFNAAIAQECDICKVKVPAFQAHYNAGRYDSIFAMLSPEMQKDFPLPQIREFLGQLQAEAGKLSSLQFKGYKKNFAYYRGAFEKAVMELDFSINHASQIDGLMVQEYDSLKPVERNKTKLSLPFRGEWAVTWGGDTKEQNYHVEALAQRRAFDFVMKGKDGKTFRGDGDKNEDYYAFGKELYAPCAGEVIFAIDGIHDNVPGEANKMYIPGNSVVIKAAEGEYVFFAHFKQGTVRVKRGQRVAKGELLGLCGNSGNSSEPHLHFHIQDGEDINTATGMKCFFEKLKVGSVVKQDYSPVRDELISAE